MGVAGLLRRSWLLRLGEWSFALYLTHLILLGLVNAVVPGINDLPLLGRLAVDVAFVGVSIAVAAAAYYVVERPMERRLRGAAPRPEMAAA